MTELKVSALRKSFRAVRAVDDVSFSVRGGEFLALIGPNGAGKSTCFNTINGQLAPDGGAIHFDGRDIAGLPPREICRRGVEGLRSSGRQARIGPARNSSKAVGPGGR